jgi:hypothetical protein
MALPLVGTRMYLLANIISTVARTVGSKNDECNGKSHLHDIAVVYFARHFFVTCSDHVYIYARLDLSLEHNKEEEAHAPGVKALHVVSGQPQRPAQENQSHWLSVIFVGQGAFGAAGLGI